MSGRDKKAETLGPSKSSADQLSQLAGLVFPIVSAGHWCFSLGDSLPTTKNYLTY
jgi:hypothetical protein